jgi:PASTA domain-containing protein
VELTHTKVVLRNLSPPVPGHHEVFVRLFYKSDIDPAQDELEHIAGDDIVRRHELETAGRGWFTWDLTLKTVDGSPDPSAPQRFSEVRLVIRPHNDCWQYRGFEVSIHPRSLNQYCFNHRIVGIIAASQNFRVSIPITPPPTPRPKPPQAAVPDVRNKTLAQAGTALSVAGFNRFQVFGPTLPPDQLRVESQSPKAGETVALTTTIWLSLAAVNAVTGFSTLTFHNASSRQKSLQLFTYDFVAGQLKDEGLVDYQDTLDVDLVKDHVYGIYAVDPTLIGCSSGQPTEAACVAWQPLNTFTGDDGGPKITVEIT